MRDEGRWTILVDQTQQPLATNAVLARTFSSRVKGLLGRRALADGEALVISRCRSIHTCGMLVPIDAVFVDRALRVVALRRGLRPWRIVPPVWKAWGVIEMAAGSLDRLHLTVGDQLTLVSACNSK